MWRRRVYQRMTAEALIYAWRAWSNGCDDWRDFAAQYPQDRQVQRQARCGMARCRRQIHRIETVPRKRGIRTVAPMP